MTWFRVVASLAAVLALTACAPELNWRDVRAEGTRVTLSLPCKPVEQRRTAQLAGQAAAMQMRVCNAGGVTWGWLWANLDDPVAVGPALNALVSGARANLGAGAAPLQTGNPPGATPRPESGRAQLVGRLPDGRHVIEHILVFAVGTQVHQVTALVAGNGERPPAPEALTAAAAICLDSVRVQP